MIDWEKRISTYYDFYIEAIQVHFDCSWSEGSVSFYHGSRDSENRLFTKRRCPKAFLWRPCQPKIIWRDVVIEYGEEGWEHSDTVVTGDEMRETVEKVEYNSKGEAHIQNKCGFSFGTSTSIIKVHRFQQYMRSFSLNVAVEFGNSEDCLRFIQHGIDELNERGIIPIENNDAHPIIDDVCKTVAHLSFDFRHAENAAIDRGLPYEDFLDEFTPPATQMIRHQASTRTENDGRPCFLMLHLDIRPWAPCDDRESYIWKAHWSATDDIPTTPARSSLFRHLNNLHLDISSLIAHASDDDSSSPPHSGALNISSSSRGISSLDVTNILSSVNGGITINGSHCPVILNCHITMRDNYSGGIYGGNVGGSNNTNYNYSYP